MRLVAGIALAATFAVLTSCAAQPEPVAPSPEPTAEPVFASEEEALAAAEHAYKAYLEVSDAILAEGGEDPERIEPFAVGAARDAALTGYEEFRGGQLRSEGNTALQVMSLQSYDPSAVVAAVIVYVCLDVSNLEVLDADGESVVTPSRPDLQAYEAVFDLHPTDPGTLLLASREPRAGEGIC